MAHISTVGAGIFSRLLVNTTPIGTTLYVGGGTGASDGGFGFSDIGDYRTRGRNGTGTANRRVSADFGIGEYFRNFIDPAVASNFTGNKDFQSSDTDGHGAGHENANRATQWGNFTYIPNMREAPSFGVPPSLVNVPEFGSKTSKQVQGQADPTNIEVSINYVAELWSNDRLGGVVGDTNSYLMAIVLANAEPAGYGLSGSGTNGATVDGDTGTTPATKPIIGWSSSAVTNNIENSIVFFVGEMSSLQFTPNLTDANQATITVALKSSFSDPYTFDRSSAVNGQLSR